MSIDLTNPSSVYDAIINGINKELPLLQWRPGIPRVEIQGLATQHADLEKFRSRVADIIGQEVEHEAKLPSFPAKAGSVTLNGLGFDPIVSERIAERVRARLGLTETDSPSEDRPADRIPINLHARSLERAASLPSRTLQAHIL
jgi:hypothetical protein